MVGVREIDFLVMVVVIIILAMETISICCLFVVVFVSSMP
jgi:hypothetical protein